MSFLAELQSKGRRLRPTTTTVQYSDGSRYRIEANGVEQKTTPSPFGFVVDTKPDREAACILPEFLYVGAQDSVDERNINEHFITHILSVGIEVPVVQADVQHCFVPCLDLPETSLVTNVLPFSNSFLEQVKRSNGRVLVHCNAGVSRSASVVIGYLIAHERMSYADALALVRRKRPCCRPNDGFAKQLIDFSAEMEKSYAE